MEINIVKIAEDKDFQDFQSLSDDFDDWTVVYSRKHVDVWTKNTGDTPFKMIKVTAKLTNIPCHVMYDVLHDSEYRTVWDKWMARSVDVGLINVNNDVCYYATKPVPPFRGRDFVFLRCWMQHADRTIIMNHSICHDEFPPCKNYIRALSYKTGYLLRPNKTEGGCQVVYITHSDPKGSLPAWAVNRLTQMVAPKMIKKLEKACVGYDSWKSRQSRPNFKPWLYPEQLVDFPRVDLSKCTTKIYPEDENVDESKFDETQAGSELFDESSEKLEL